MESLKREIKRLNSYIKVLLKEHESFRERATKEIRRLEKKLQVVQQRGSCKRAEMPQKLVSQTFSIHIMPLRLSWSTENRVF